LGGQRFGAAVVACACLVALAVLPGCSAGGDEPVARGRLDDDVVTVGSFDFPESVLLAELYSQALERSGLRVRRSFQLGPRELVAPALAQGLIEVVPEYLGTMRQFLAVASATDAVELLSPAPAQDSNAIVVTRETARRFHLEKVSDLRPVARRLTFGGPPECPSRPLCLSGLRRTYGLRFGEFVRLDTGGPVTHQALLAGSVDVALLFSSDPSLVQGADLVELEDDRDLQPQESVTPLVLRAVLARFPRMAPALNELSEHLTDDDLRSLNARVAPGTKPVTAIASTWLDREGIT
jgi:osmoprotectant transport system substrate-binding protein